MRRLIVLMAALTLAILTAGCGDDGGPAAVGSGGGAPGDADGALDDVLDGVLDDLADGSLDSTDLGDLMDSAEDMAESFGDSGSGTVTINGDTIEFTSEICFSGQGDFTIEGLGTTGDGTPVWVSISQSVDSREEILEQGFLTEEMLNQFYGDADPIIDSSLSLEYGKSELFGSGSDDLPDFDASSGIGGDQLEMTVDGQTATGSGEASDFNYVAGDFAARFPFTFTAGCG